MPYARVLLELLHLAAGLVATAAIFGAAAWAYPQGHATIWNIGFVTMAAVAGMSIPQFRDAWAGDRGKQQG